jgi:NADH-quinone oxidoreductase subunit F
LADVDERTAERAEERCYRVHLCFGPNCSERGSRALMPLLERAVRDANLADRVEVLATTCRNRCDYGPSLNVYPGPVFYNFVDDAAIRDIVETHLAGGEVADVWLYRPKLVGTRRE